MPRVRYSNRSGFGVWNTASPDGTTAFTSSFASWYDRLRRTSRESEERDRHHFSLESLDHRQPVLVAAPPDSIVPIKLPEPLLRQSPKGPGAGPLYQPSARTSDRVCPLTVEISRGDVTGLPGTPRVIVRVLVSPILLLSPLHWIRNPPVRVLRKDQHIVVVLREMPGRVLWCKYLLPDGCSDKVSSPENFVHQRPKVWLLVIVNRDPDAPVV